MEKGTAEIVRVGRVQQAKRCNLKVSIEIFLVKPRRTRRTA